METSMLTAEMADYKAKLNVNEENYELDVYTPNLGPSAIDITPLVKARQWTKDEGFRATASCCSTITFIDGIKGILLHRGYPIDQLAEACEYLEVCYLLLYEKLPNKKEKDAFYKKINDNSLIHEQITRFFSGFRRDAHPMAIMVGVVGALSAFYHDALDIQQEEDRFQCATHLIAKMPVIAAMCHKYTIGEPFVFPRHDMSYAENFLNMMFGRPHSKERPDPILVRAMDRIFTLHADHEQNASTTTVRVAGSTGANPFACISAGIGALWGPAHGGANEAALNMLKEIGDESNIEDFLARVKDPNDETKLMGFGHRVYKSYDPRATIMHKTCHEVLDAVGAHNDPLFKLAMKLEKIALEDEYFVKRNLYPNVDFYSGITLSALGIPTNMFTVIFALARTVGWISNWLEMVNDPNQGLYRPRQLYVGETQRDVPTERE